ncbi:MAG: threonine--tRNA ligase, partial [Bacteroidales bacterium]|nr:threonine--tRNA ligase [Bacteroidales bacterium]
MERFVAVLLEHTGGNFPLWLTPDQVIILPISEKFLGYAQKVREILDDNDIRAIVDERNEKAGRKIRDAEVSKVPFMVIVGEKEETDGTVSVRQHGAGDKGTMPIADFISLIKQTIDQELQK